MMSKGNRRVWSQISGRAPQHPPASLYLHRLALYSPSTFRPATPLCLLVPRIRGSLLFLSRAIGQNERKTTA